MSATRLAIKQNESAAVAPVAEFPVLARFMSASRCKRAELVRQGMDARPDGAQVDSVSLRYLVASRLGNLRIDARVGRKADSIHVKRGHNISAWCDASAGSET
jgi:hypothetical protein